MWAPIMEKAWSKVKGSYTNADGGYSDTGMRAIVGAPSVQMTGITSDQIDATFQLIQAADAANYVMGAGTNGGGGSDDDNNICGIATSHAYSMIAAFTMTDANSVAHDMVMMRNPWGMCTYTGTWKKDDSNWTEDLVAQVPHSVDPRTACDADGIFVIPKAYLRTSYGCIDELNIAHYRDAEGYTTTWYDEVDA